MFTGELTCIHRFGSALDPLEPASTGCVRDGFGAARVGLWAAREVNCLALPGAYRRSLVVAMRLAFSPEAEGHW